MIDAGEALFLRDGLRGATMEAIARRAGVAKATLYSYFPDKEAVFDAVLGRLARKLTQIVEQELARDGPVALRIAGALAAKHRIVFRMLEGSPHAAELYEAGAPGNASGLIEFDRWLDNEIVRALQEGSYTDAVQLANILSACAEGIAMKARHAEEIGPAIRLVAERLLARPSP